MPCCQASPGLSGKGPSGLSQESCRTPAPRPMVTPRTVGQGGPASLPFHLRHTNLGPLPHQLRSVSTNGSQTQKCTSRPPPKNLGSWLKEKKAFCLSPLLVWAKPEWGPHWGSRSLLPGHLETLEAAFMSAVNPPGPSGGRNAARAAGHHSPPPRRLPRGRLFPTGGLGAPERTAGPRAGAELGFPGGGPQRGSHRQQRALVGTQLEQPGQAPWQRTKTDGPGTVRGLPWLFFCSRRPA